jgi:4-carboxymuconolactone decarboxylase
MKGTRTSRPAESIYALNQYLRKTVAGARHFELAALIAAREFDQQYEWSAHQPAAIRAGAEQSIVDAIKFNRSLNGVPEKDAALIRLGRAIFRDHKVSSEVWAQMQRLFGRQGAVQLTMVMADYAMVGFVLTAVDQQLPPAVAAAALRAKVALPPVRFPCGL